MAKVLEHPIEAGGGLAKPLQPVHNSGPVRTIGAGEFKAKCLKLLDEVAKTGEAIIVTKFGKPVAQIVPPPRQYVDIIGAMKGSVLWEGDIISPLEDEWEANQ
jgi:prevent-host-death family protein